MAIDALRFEELEIKGMISILPMDLIFLIIILEIKK